MTRYNRKSIVYASFGLIALGFVTILARAGMVLIPSVRDTVPRSGIPFGTLSTVLAIVSGLSILGSMCLFAYIVIKSLSRIESKGYWLEAEMKKFEYDVGEVKGNVSLIQREIAMILEREREQDAGAPTIPPRLETPS